jgi:hypothetical protein
VLNCINYHRDIPSGILKLWTFFYPLHKKACFLLGNLEIKKKIHIMKCFFLKNPKHVFAYFWCSIRNWRKFDEKISCLLLTAHCGHVITFWQTHGSQKSCTKFPTRENRRYEFLTEAQWNCVDCFWVMVSKHTNSFGHSKQKKNWRIIIL